MRYQYYAKAGHAAADYKAVARRVRAACPQLFVARELRDSQMDGDGRVTVSLRKDVRAVPMTPRERHAFATKDA